MRRFPVSVTVLGLLSSVAAAQPGADLPAPEVKKPNAGFDKGFFLRSDDGRYSMVLTGRIQPFYDLTRSSVTSPVDADDQIIDYKSQLEVRRARLVLEGNLHGKSVTYKFQLDFGKGVASIKDVHFDVELQPDVWLRFGQWKRPFSRQQITSSGRLEITDRSITDRAFGAGRDVGIALRNNYEKSPELEWTLGVFDGTGEAPRLTGPVTVDPATGMGTIGATTNTNVPSKFKPAVIGRVGINRNGLKGYSEADLEGGPLRYGIAASVWLEGDFDDDHHSNQKVEIDETIKADGFSTTGGVYALTDQSGPSVLDAETSLIGFHLQAGYMANKHWQPAARYAYVNDPRHKAKTSHDQQEISIGCNFYGVGHDAKFAGAMRLIKTGEGSFTDAVLFELGANVGW